MAIGSPLAPAFAQDPNTGYFLSNFAEGTYEAAGSWSLAHTVTGSPVRYVAAGASTTFSYEIAVSAASLPRNVRVAGTIQLDNQGASAILADVSSALKPPLAGSCTVFDAYGGNGSGLLVPIAFSEQLTFECELPDGFVADPGVVESTAQYMTLDSGAVGSLAAVVAFSWTPLSAAGGCARVEATFAAQLSTTFTQGTLPDVELCPGEDGLYKYDASVTSGPGCIDYVNAATVTQLEGGGAQRAEAAVRVCGTAKTGALGPGYWQNKNGQARISQGAVEADGLTCKAYSYLAGFAPFGDVTAIAPRSCAKVAGWVAGVMRRGGSGGSTMPEQLRAQMLASALDVFFVASGLGELDVDLTRIPAPNGLESASASFAVRSHMTVNALLSHAAAQFMPGNQAWYGGSKRLQELAKDTFAAINGEQVFAWAP